MRIDNRKVNGQITIEPGDTVDGLKILWNDTEINWISGFESDISPIILSDATAAAYLQTALATMQPLKFIIMRLVTLIGEGIVYPERTYSCSLDRKTIFIDVNDLQAGKKLKITVLTGAIELVDNE